ncbi:hypothetical protein J2W25_000850 [Variovorax boronicumulans]|uniref:Restriction endonuclease n=1 Tax=Variovorax boronicumulans TaxID=436515 RepID=A0AAW8DQP4_9BURK|nr:hypothetical protein [Variovorax boronicumulans]MDP9877287.1 hypothetical protein [Variovorax boronicumulans]MDP9921835.1 hypothetical protein [Variovorax boronicumulans]
MDHTQATPTDKFRVYREFQSLLSQYNLQQSLEDLWWYSRMFEPSSTVPIAKISVDGQVIPISTYLGEWDIPVIAREVVLYASKTGTKRLNTWLDFSGVLEKLREVSAAMAAISNAEDAYNSLHPTIQQQLKRQGRHSINDLVRAYKIFSASGVEKLLIRETGIPMKVWTLVGFAIAGAMQKDAGINAGKDYTPFGVSKEISRALFTRISRTAEELRELTAREQLQDERWQYTPNPMLSYPLVSVLPGEPHLLHCPLPNYVLERVSSGLYYDIAMKPGFEKPFGAAFENYVGELLHLVFQTPRFTVAEEQPYRVGKNQKHGVDWVVVDEEANLFLECKAKRMSKEGRLSSDPDILRSAVDVLAQGVVKLYKNIEDARQGRTPQWKPNNRPIYPVLLTLEDWILAGPADDLLRKAVAQRFSEANLNPAWLTEMPYSIESCGQFELVSSTIAEVGIGTFFKARFDGETAKWRRLNDVAHHYFKEIYKRTANRELFFNDWANAFPPGTFVNPSHP